MRDVCYPLTQKESLFREFRIINISIFIKISEVPLVKPQNVGLNVKIDSPNDAQDVDMYCEVEESYFGNNIA